jgi:hypothetical protein
LDMVLFPIDANDSGEWLIGLEQISALVRTVQLKAKKRSKKRKILRIAGSNAASTVKMETAAARLSSIFGDR